MANTFLDMFREFSGRRQQQSQFDSQLAQANLDRDLRSQALAAEQSRFDKSYQLNQAQLEEAKRRAAFDEQTKVLEGISGGTLKLAPTQQVSLAPTQSTTTNGELPSDAQTLDDLPSSHNVNANSQFVSAQLPAPNSFFLGGTAVQPTTPLERGKDNLSLQEMLLESKDKHLQKKAAMFSSDPDMQRLYMAANGDIDRLTNTPESALSAMLLSGNHSSKDIQNALGKVLQMKYMSRINPFTAQLAQLNIQEKRNQLAADQALGTALQQVENDPNFKNADPITKTAEARRRIAASGASPAVVTKGMTAADNTQSAPNVPRPQSALDIYLNQRLNSATK